MAHKFLELLTSPAALEAQQSYYGRSRPIPPAAGDDAIGAREAEFIAARDSFYLASVSDSVWPYLQHRGGPAGFLRVLGPHTLAFADYEGNHQLLTTGNLATNDRVALFLMDYANRRRLKILGHARIVDARERPDLVAAFRDADTPAPIERLVFIEVVSFDWNCPQHITPRFTAAQVAAAVEPLQRQIGELQAKLAAALAAQRDKGEPA